MGFTSNVRTAHAWLRPSDTWHPVTMWFPSCARQLAEERDALLSSSEFHQLCPEDQHRIRNTFAIAELMEANRFGAPGRGSFEEPDPDPELGFESPLDLEDLLDAWEGREMNAIKRFTLSGDLRPLVSPTLTVTIN